MDELHEWLSKHGLDISPVLDGHVHRFNNDGKNDKSGWYCGDVKIISGKRITSLTVKDWRWGDEEKLYFRSGGFVNGDYEKYREEITKKNACVEKERAAANEEACKEAERIWESAGPVSKDNAYCIRKGLGDCQGFGIKEAPGNILVIPIRDIEGKLWGIQRIYPDGTKRFLKGQRTHGLYHSIHQGITNTIYLCEGFATAASVHLATRLTTFCAFNAGNLLQVAKVIRQLHANINIIVCGDDDVYSAKNIGKEKADEAARACGGLAVFPEFTGGGFDNYSPEKEKAKDWNDLFCLEGVNEVTRQIRRAINQPDDRSADQERLVGNGSIAVGSGRVGNLGDDGYKSGLGREEKQSNDKEIKHNGNDGSKEVVTGVVKTEVEKIPPAYRITEIFLKENGFYSKENTSLLRYYKRDFYRYKNGDNNFYQLVDDEWLSDLLYRWLISVGWGSVIETKKLPAINKIIKTRPRYIPERVKTPCINKEHSWEDSGHLIPLKNGLFDALKFVSSNEVRLLPHTPEFFCTYSLPYAFDKNADCPIFDSICEQIFQGPKEVEAFEEMLGVHIFMPFLIEKFFVLCGDGGNGKGVIYTIMQCLLGMDNISNVTIDCFNSSNFAFYNIVGKLANIIPDMHDVGEIDEGTLKAYVSRETMLFNRKNKPHISAEPSAFLTICTNQLPRFNDKSEGIWRRMIIFKFDKNIPTEKQNPKYRERWFWEESGELPGIFNKALIGLKRVIDRGFILETENMKAEVSEYKNELNFVAQFAESSLVFAPEYKSKSKEFYNKYVELVKESNGKPLSAPSFCRQLKAVCKKMGHPIYFGEGNERVGSYVGRMWHGCQLSYGDDSLPF